MTNNITESRMIELIQEELLNKISEIQLTSLLGSNEVTKLSLLNEAFPSGTVASKNGPPVGRWNDANIIYLAEKIITDLDAPEQWQVDNLMRQLLRMMWNDKTLSQADWNEFVGNEASSVVAVFSSALNKAILSNGKTVWNIVDPFLEGSTMGSLKSMMKSIGGKIWSVAGLFKPHTPKNQWDKDTLGEFTDEYIEWRENNGAWVGALEWVAVGTMGLAAIFGATTAGAVLVPAATVSAFYLAAVETPYVIDAIRRGKYGLAIVRGLIAYLGVLSKGWKALKALSKGAPPAAIAALEAAQLTLSKRLIKVGEEVMPTVIALAAGSAVYYTFPGLKAAYDDAATAYAKEICRDETGTFDMIKGQKECDLEIAAFYDGKPKQVLTWSILNDRETAAEFEKAKKEAKSVADDIGKPLNVKNENVFYENRFSQLAGI